jgi:hypothetical protein
MLRRWAWPFIGLVLTAACAGVDRVVPEYSDIYRRPRLLTRRWSPCPRQRFLRSFGDRAECHEQSAVGATRQAATP